MSPPYGSVTSAPSMLVRRSEPVSSSVAGLIATPGTTSHASWKRRFVVTGTAVSALLLMFTDSPARSGSTMGASPVTVTVSDTDPTLSVKSTSITPLRRTVALRMTLWKPESSAFTS